MAQSQSEQIESSRGWLVILSDASLNSGMIVARFSPQQESKARREQSRFTKVRRETYSEAARRLNIQLN